MAEVFESLVHMFTECSRRYAERDALGTKRGTSWEWTTYADLARQVDAVRGGLASRGVRAGDRVAIISDNRLEWATACHATYGLGAAFVPLYVSQLPEDWTFILRDSGAKVVFVATPQIARTIEEARPSLPALEHLILLDEALDEPNSYLALCQAGERDPAPATSPSATDLAGLIYTSGTTGLPKGVLLTHGNVTSNINAIHSIFTFSPDERSLAFLPWAHSFGQTCELHGLLSMGCSIAINDDVTRLVANLAEVRPTILFAVPRVFHRIYDGVNEQISGLPGVVEPLVRAGLEIAKRKAKGETLGVFEEAGLWLVDTLVLSRIRGRFGGRLEYAISGSAALPPELAEFIDALGIQVYEGYGLTETSPIVAANFPGARRVGSVGRPIPGVRVEIDRTVAQDSREGEVVVYGPNVMRGYHQRPEETAAALTDDGGLRTGDLGYLDEDGYLYITGRIKEQYKLENGKYVVPSVLEERLKLSPYVANVLVFGTDRPYNVALIVLDMPAIERWAEANHVTVSDPTTDSAVHTLIEQEIDLRLEGIRGYERLKKFRLLTEDFTIENGLLTPTFKLKRRPVEERYEGLLKEMYG